MFISPKKDNHHGKKWKAIKHPKWKRRDPAVCRPCVDLRVLCRCLSNLELCHDLVAFILFFCCSRHSDRGRGGWLRLGLRWNLGGLGLGSGRWSVLFTLLLAFIRSKLIEHSFLFKASRQSISNHVVKSEL